MTKKKIGLKKKNHYGELGSYKTNPFQLKDRSGCWKKKEQEKKSKTWKTSTSEKCSNFNYREEEQVEGKGKCKMKLKCSILYHRICDLGQMLCINMVTQNNFIDF
jgi:hypothetical protein